MRSLPSFLSLFAAASLLPAQGGDLLFTTSQTERTLSLSGGTVLQDLHPNEIVGLQVFPCPSRAEKWSPRSCFHTMAGDEDGDGDYWEPGLLGAIDALMTTPSAVGMAGLANQRTIWYSPSVALGTAVSGGPGLRPGDIGRIVRTTAGDGRVEHFIRREQINQALGLPLTTAIDVDAAAFGPNFGLFLSLDGDHVVSPCGGPVLLRDGDVFCLPIGNITWSTSGTVAGVIPNSAVVVFTEAQMDMFVANAGVTNRFGTCVTQVIDTESLEIDWQNPGGTAIPGCFGTPVFVPNFLFTAESLTGGAVLTTAFGGQIHNSGCMPLGRSCGSGPTLGDQIGLLPPSSSVGVPSYVNALASTRLFTYTAETKVPQIPVWTSAQVDFNTPGLNTWVFLTFAPTGPGAVPPSTPFVWGLLGFPDYYLVPNFMTTIPGGFATYTSPAIPWPCKLIFQGVTITFGGTIEASTPTLVEVY